MKTPDEIKRLLANHKNYIFSAEELFADALTYIRQLEAELAQVKRERDAATNDLKDALERGDAASFCEFCKHNDDWGKCEHPCNPYSGETGWEWRGLPKEE